MNNLLLRAITGTVFVGLIVGSLWFGRYPTIITMSLFFILGSIEFINLFKENKVVQLSTRLTLTGSILIFGIIIATVLGIVPTFSPLLILPFIFLLFLTELWRKKENPLINIGIMTFHLFYLLVPFILIIFLNLNDGTDNFLVIGMFLLIWTNDTFAYLTGRLIGKTKLFERISPKKTWEGTIGGILFTILSGYFIGIFTHHYPPLFWIISACIIAPCAIFGDLLESLFKRSLNIKDSGTILPGHGGILDRFDATLFTVPFFYCWTMIYSLFLKPYLML